MQLTRKVPIGRGGMQVRLPRKARLEWASCDGQQLTVATSRTVRTFTFRTQSWGTEG